MDKGLIRRHREFLKDSMRGNYDFSATDQHRGVPAPPVQKPCGPGSVKVPLPSPGQCLGSITGKDLMKAVTERESRRRYLDAPLSLDEVSLLLYCTQGIRQTRRPSPALRTVPSAGARHSFETYLLIRKVTGLRPGLYRYLPLEHELVFLGDVPNAGAEVARACFGQQFVGAGAVTFVWATIPYRMEWRYGPLAHRVILLDAGHVCQNLYLACEAIGAGTCAVAAYDQDAVDSLIGVDGEDEFAVYLAPVGKVKG